MILYHYTDEKGFRGILETLTLKASTSANNPNDVRHGNGQYFSDIPPGAKSLAQLSREFLNLPFLGRRFTHYVAIDVDGLDVVEGRPGVFVLAGEMPLNLAGRIVASGVVPTSPREPGVPS